MNISAQELAHLLNADIEGDGEVRVSAPSRIEEGAPGTLTFLANPKYEQHIYDTDASIVLVSRSFTPSKTIKATLLRVDNVYESMANLLERFGEVTKEAAAVSDQASVHPSASLDEDVSLGAFTSVAESASIGRGTEIHGNVTIGKNVTIGSNCVLHPGVRIYHACKLGNNVILHSNTVIGSDGFGYAPNEDGSFKKIPQLGNVVIEDNVEIGSNCAIDRASMGSTIIRKGAKLDNLVHIAHNVEIGEHTALAGQVGIAGSTKLGKYCQVGGQAGIIGHIKVADGARIQAQSGVISNTEENVKIQGSPAMDYGGYYRSIVIFKKLPELASELSKLVKRVSKLEDTR